ncbi:MAG: hypothetical protein U1D30_09580 [Planctomycetota bacterium]
MRALCAFGVAVLLACGCAKEEPPKMVSHRVQWVDKQGKVWFAPAVTPAADDPVHQQHPEPGVVALDRKTGKRTVIKDPSAVVEQQRALPSPRYIFVTEADGR